MSELRELERRVCEALEIPSAGWIVEYESRHDPKIVCRSNPFETENEACEWRDGMARCRGDDYTVGGIHEAFPEVVSEPEAFELVVEILAERDITVEIDFHIPEARITLCRSGEVEMEYIPGKTWREAVCRAVVEWERLEWNR